MRAGFCGGFVAQWLWLLQSDTLGSSPPVAVFLFFFSFLPKQVKFQLYVLPYLLHTCLYIYIYIYMISYD